MKAAWYEKIGAADEVLQLGEMADPNPKAGEVLVEIKASGVNPSDVKIRAGAGEIFNFLRSFLIRTAVA